MNVAATPGSSISFKEEKLKFMLVGSSEQRKLLDVEVTVDLHTSLHSVYVVSVTLQLVYAEFMTS